MCWKRINNLPPGLAFRFSFWHTGGRCQLSGDIEAEQ